MTLCVVHTRRHIEFNNTWTSSKQGTGPLSVLARKQLNIEISVMTFGMGPSFIVKPYYNSS